MKTILLSLALTLAACGAAPQQSEYFTPDFDEFREFDLSIDPALAPVVDEFLAECDSRNFGETCRSELARMKSVRFGALAAGRAGRCDQANGRPLEVVIAPEIPESWYRPVVFHELAHCLLDLEHDETSSIMRSEGKVWGPEFEGEGWQTSVEDLFQIKTL